MSYVESLSYSALKTANQAREAEEERSQIRKKNLLVLILHHLMEEGFIESAKALENETNLNVSRFEVCDNIDLETVLQDYESYYYIKFNRYPKVTKKVSSGNPHQSRMSKLNSKSKGSTPSLPRIPQPPEQQPQQQSQQPSSGAAAPSSASSTSANSSSSRMRPKSGSVAQVKRQQQRDKDSQQHSGKNSGKDHSHKQMNGGGVVGGEHPLSDLSVSGSTMNGRGGPEDKPHHNSGKLPPRRGPIIDMRAMLNNAIKGAGQDIGADDHNPTDRLMKPLGGFAGYSLEWRELAQTISRDIYMHSPDVRWNDIVGLENPKRLVKEAVVYPIKYPQLFTGILSPWKGLLLYGPPGTGKTLLAKAVATECNTTFFNISASSIVSKWRGDSEKLVRVLFELARFHAPSTIFLDELESIMSQRGGGGSEHEGSRRMKTELLVQMDGLAKSDDLVFLLAASNLPWELDHAMLRRLEKRILIDLPTFEARKKMFQFHLPAVLDQRVYEIRTEIDYDLIAEKTEGYSGADIWVVCKEAGYRTIRKVTHVLESHDRDSYPDLEFEPITTEDLILALEKTKPSASLLKDKYLDWQKQYESCIS